MPPSNSADCRVGSPKGDTFEFVFDTASLGAVLANAFKRPCPYDWKELRGRSVRTTAHVVCRSLLAVRVGRRLRLVRCTCRALAVSLSVTWSGLPSQIASLLKVQDTANARPSIRLFVICAAQNPRWGRDAGPRVRVYLFAGGTQPKELRRCATWLRRRTPS